MASLRNPNILMCMGVTKLKNHKQAIVMEYMPNGDLRGILKNKAIKLTLPKQILMGLDICKGMAWLAGQNILHRDLKPANVMIDSTWTCKVADFGLSQIKMPKQILHGDNIGSPFWMAPEALLDKEVDTKVDVYAFALVFWEILTRKSITKLWDAYKTVKPFKTDIVKHNLRPPIKNIDSELAMILADSWHGNPQERPTFVELIQKLERVLLKFGISYKIFPNAAAFWEKFFPGSISVPWSFFFGKFFRTCAQKCPLQHRIPSKCPQKPFMRNHQQRRMCHPSKI